MKAVDLHEPLTESSGALLVAFEFSVAAAPNPYINRRVGCNTGGLESAAAMGTNRSQN